MQLAQGGKFLFNNQLQNTKEVTEGWRSLREMLPREELWPTGRDQG